MKLQWETPPGTVYGLYKLILDQTHTLIAGATGSGKSVAINGIIYTALYQPPQDLQFVLIDPKRVELVKYRKLPHCIAYASEPADIVRTLKKCVDLMERRYKVMQARGMVKSTEPETYIVIDEFADPDNLVPICFRFHRVSPPIFICEQLLTTDSPML